MRKSVADILNFLSKKKNGEAPTPQNTQWSDPKLMAFMTCLVATVAFYKLADKQYNQPELRHTPVLAFAGWIAYRSIKNVRDTYRAADASRRNEGRELHAGSQQLTINLSERESWNALIGSGIAGVVASVPEVSVVAASAATAAVALSGRAMLTTPEGDKGHFRPKWLRKVPEGSTSGPSGP